MAGQLDRMTLDRGSKLNVLGPRGGAKSTVGTLAYPLREALECREPYIWIVSDTKEQGQLHLANLKAELLENPVLAAAYPDAAGRGPVWRAGAVVLRNGVTIEAFGTGQRIRGRRCRENRPTLIVCDDLHNDVPKRVRIRRLGPLLAARRIRMKSDSATTRLLVDQLQQFPLGDHDDGPDALEMALRLAEELLAGVPDDGLRGRVPV